MKNKRLLFSLPIATLGVAVPLVCAASKVTVINQTNDVTIDFFFGPTNKNKYSITFNDSTKTCRMTRMEMNETTEIFYVPATCPRSANEEYPLTALACAGSPKKDIFINILDFSQAKNLSVIENYCFDDRTGAKLRWVNFAGATNLTRIGTRAFYNQWFSNSVVGKNCIMDLSDTKIEEIASEAFSGCCQNEHNEFDKIIFPSTLKYIRNNAFHYASDKRKNAKIAFEQIVFTRSSDIPSDMLQNTNCLPRLLDQKLGRINVPHGTQETYRSLQNSTQNKDWNNIVSGSYVESILSFKEGYKGSNKIVAKKDSVGVDTAPWIPYSEKTLTAEKQCQVSISNSFNGLVEIDADTKKIKWKSIPNAGIYTFTVTAWYRDILTGYTHYANSGRIELEVIDPKLVGGSTYLYGYEGKDTNSWKIDFLGGDESIRGLVKNDIQYSISKPLDFDGEINLTTSGQKGDTSCVISWSCNDITIHKIFPCVLTAKIEFDNIVVESSTTIYIVTTGYYNILIKNKDTGEDIDTLSLSEVESKTVQVILETKVKVDDATPQFSLNSPGITVAKDAGSIDLKQIYNVTFQSGNDYIKPGKYEGYFYLPIKYKYGEEEYFIPATSNYFTLKVQNSEGKTFEDTDLKFSGGNQILATYKNYCGSDTSDWQITGNMLNDGWSCKSLTFVSTPWFVESSAERLGHLQSKEVATNSYRVGWDATYCTNEDIIDIFNFNIQVAMQKEDQVVYVYAPVTTMSINTVEFTKNDTLIDAIPNQAGSHSLPWTAVFNNDPSLVDNDIEFDLNLEGSGLTKDQIYMERSQGKANTAVLKWNNNIEKGYYLIAIKVYSEKYYTSAESNPILLSVQDQIEIVDVPQIIECEVGSSGSYPTPVSTYINGVKSNDVTYSLLTITDEIKIDPATGIISWVSPKLPTTSAIIIQATIKQGEEEQVAYSTFTFKVNAKTKDNSKWIALGIGLGSGVVGAGIGTGATLLIKNKYNKKRESKK